MDDKRPTAVSAVGPLASRIEQLELEERDAIRRRDWSTARGIAQERAALKEAHHRALARRGAERVKSPGAARKA
jgi:hypothetical protein